MNISGTLHLYSGARLELFFVFDDDVAQTLSKSGNFDPDDIETRRAYISVGTSRLIHRRTLSFSKKQTEIKVSLCSKGAKNDLGALTTLYDWFVPGDGTRPEPIEILGTLRKRKYEGTQIRELYLTEPTGLVVPPGLRQRKKKPSAVKRSFEHRRAVVEQDLAAIGDRAEELALEIAENDWSNPCVSCLWRRSFLDSERVEIRKLGIIADIDVWNGADDRPELFIEVKAQKVKDRATQPRFYLSKGEWRSVQKANTKGLRYEVWLFQYHNVKDFSNAPEKVKLLVFDSVDPDWLEPDGYVVAAPVERASEFSITR